MKGASGGRKKNPLLMFWVKIICQMSREVYAWEVWTQVADLGRITISIPE